MRLSLRLMAERNGRAGGLGPYLDDPVLLFVPVRLLMGLIVTVATVFWAACSASSACRASARSCSRWRSFVIVFEHLLPLLIVRRDPERVLDFLMPSFDLIARAAAADHARAGGPHRHASARARVGGGAWRRGGRSTPKTRRSRTPSSKRVSTRG